MPFQTLGGKQSEKAPAGATHPLTVGLALSKGSGSYILDQVRVQVLQQGEHVSGSKGEMESGNFDADTAAYVRERRASKLSAADRTFTLTFDGRDDEGNPLPAGAYEVGFSITSHPAPGNDCARARGSEATAVSGLLTVINWQP